jgi:AraC-like DNA-binding protein
MAHIISIMPGLGFASILFLSIIGFYQRSLYRKTGYQGSKDLSTFCFFTAFFAGAPFIAHSRNFSPEFLHTFTHFSILSLCVSLIYYLKAISYFITVPKRIYRLFIWAFSFTSILALATIPVYFIFSYSVYFDTNHLVETSSFFVNSYTNRIGATLPLGMRIMSLQGFLSSLLALYLLRIVFKSSLDIFFIFGLSLTIISSLVERVMLAFTTDYFFPMVFLSNLFEAYRMSHLTQTEYYREQVLKESGSPGDPASEETEKYKNSNLNEDRLLELAEKITTVFNKEKIYLNPNLNAEQLAHSIGIPSYQISQVINIGLKTTFFDLLSHSRIEEVKIRLADPQWAQKNIIEIAYDCGFNSKSAFNTAFKKYTNMTPSVYRSQFSEKSAPL